MSKFENFILALFGTGFIAINIDLDIVWTLVFRILAAVVFVTVAYIIYLIVSYIVEDLVKWLGKLLVKISKWYPKFWYRPIYHYFFDVINGREVKLRIISSKTNDTYSRFGLTFEGVKLINGSQEEQKKIDILISEKLPNFEERFLYTNDKMISGDKIILRIAEVSNFNLNLIFKDSVLSLYPGKYVYSFTEWGTHRGRSFTGSTIKRRISVNHRGEVELLN